MLLVPVIVTIAIVIGDILGCVLNLWLLLSLLVLLCLFCIAIAITIIGVMIAVCTLVFCSLLIVLGVFLLALIVMFVFSLFLPLSFMVLMFLLFLLLLFFLFRMVIIFQKTMSNSFYETHRILLGSPTKAPLVSTGGQSLSKGLPGLGKRDEMSHKETLNLWPTRRLLGEIPCGSSSFWLRFDVNSKMGNPRFLQEPLSFW